MRFGRSAIATGAAGLLAGYLVHKLPLNRQLRVESAKPVDLDVDAIVAADIERHAIEFVPVMKYGFPSYDTLRVKGDYVLSYDRRNKVPNWVMEHLTSDMTFPNETETSRSRCDFSEDKTIHEYFRATKKDFKNSGYDKGHLAAAANYKHSQESLKDTFVMSNITPQNKHFNQVTWHALEKHVRDLVQRYGSVYVCSGPLYIPRVIEADDDEWMQLLQDNTCKTKKRRKDNSSGCPKQRKFVIYETIGENNVAVPTHFFKVIVCEIENDMYDMEAYIIPNETLNSKIPLEDYMVPRDAIERAAGFLLFHHIPQDTFRRINGIKEKYY